MHPNAQRNERRAKLYQDLAEKERLEREAQKEALSNSVGKGSVKKGAPRTAGTKKRAQARTSGRSKG